MVVATRHPADELADIRSDLKRLRRREMFLSQGFLNDSLPCIGRDVIAQVKPLQKRVFLREKLPDHILNDEAFWRTEYVREVQFAPISGAAGVL